MVMTIAETIAFEGMILMSGFLPEPATHVSAMGITFTICGLVFSVEMGVAGALATQPSSCRPGSCTHCADQLRQPVNLQGASNEML